MEWGRPLWYKPPACRRGCKGARLAAAGLREPRGITFRPRAPRECRGSWRGGGSDAACGYGERRVRELEGSCRTRTKRRDPRQGRDSTGLAKAPCSEPRRATSDAAHSRRPLCAACGGRGKRKLVETGGRPAPCPRWGERGANRDPCRAPVVVKGRAARFSPTAVPALARQSPLDVLDPGGVDAFSRESNARGTEDDT